jgi:hypothetical protein
MTDWLGMIPGPRAPRAELRTEVLGRAEQRRRPVSGRGLAAAAVLAVLLAGGAYWGWRTIGALRLERDGLVAALAAARDTLGFVRSAATRAVTVPISTSGHAGSVTILADSATRRWLVRCEHMAPNAPDQAYQIWFLTERGMRHAALMPMDPGDAAVMTMVFEVPGDAGRVSGAAMSIEPRAGSAQPRGPMVFRVLL